MTLMEKLFELMQRMDQRKPREGQLEGDMNGCLRRYYYFIYNSTYGRDCKYAAKYKDIFLNEDYEDIKKLFLEALTEFRNIEGDEFGK